MNGGTPGGFPAGVPPAGWNLGQVNTIMNNARNALVANPAATAVPFIQADYDAAMIAWLNIPANQGGLPAAVFRS